MRAELRGDPRDRGRRGAGRPSHLILLRTENLGPSHRARSLQQVEVTVRGGYSLSVIRVREVWRHGSCSIGRGRRVHLRGRLPRVPSAADAPGVRPDRRRHPSRKERGVRLRLWDEMVPTAARKHRTRNEGPAPGAGPPVLRFERALWSGVRQEVQTIVAVAQRNDPSTTDELVGELDTPEVVASHIDELGDLIDAVGVEPGHPESARVP